MKFKIIVSSILLTLIIAFFNVVNIGANDIETNQDNINKLNISFLSLSKEVKEINKTIERLNKIRAGQHTTIELVSRKVDRIDQINSEIYSILQELDSIIKTPYETPSETVEEEENLGVNAGLGVLTGTHVLGLESPLDLETEPGLKEIEEPVIVPCPKATNKLDFNKYIKSGNIPRKMEFNVLYVVASGKAQDITIEGTLNSSMRRAALRYVNDLTFPSGTYTNCVIPFTINI